MLHIGLDVHKNYSYAVVLKNGSVIMERKIPNSKLKEFFMSFPPKSVVIAMEASGMIEPIFNMLEEMGHIVKVAHPLKTKAIAYARIKTDKVDARILAELSSANLLPESYIPPKKIRMLRDLCRERIFRVRIRTKLKNWVRSRLIRRGINVPSDYLFTKKGMEWMRSLNMRDINSTLAMIDSINCRINELDNEIYKMTKDIEDIRLLESIPGIGRYSAALIYAEIGEINRFISAEHLCSYAGIVPSTHQSGDTLRYGGITRDGRRYLRWIMVECALVHVMRFNSSITCFYKRLCKRKSKMEALVATEDAKGSILLKEKRPFQMWKMNTNTENVKGMLN